MKRKLVQASMIAAMAIFGTLSMNNALATNSKENSSAQAIRVDSNEEKSETYNIHTAAEPLVDVANNKFELAEILKRHKGKLIYLDVWASWCGPCRKEMPHSKELQKEYGDRVVFLYISCDKSEADWKKAHAEENFGESTSFRIPEMKDSNLMSGLEITGIPRYVLFDQEGNLVEKRAARPSSEQVRSMFDQYLNGEKSANTL